MSGLDQAIRDELEAELAASVEKIMGRDDLTDREKVEAAFADGAAYAHNQTGRLLTDGLGVEIPEVQRVRGKV